MSRRVYRKRSFPALRRMRVIKVIYWRRFKLSIIDNNFYSWKYEWRVEPTDSVTKRLMRGEKLIADPTSTKRRSFTIYNGKVCINELHHPRWYLS